MWRGTVTAGVDTCVWSRHNKSSANKDRVAQWDDVGISCDGRQRHRAYGSRRDYLRVVHAQVLCTHSQSKEESAGRFDEQANSPAPFENILVASLVLQHSLVVELGCSAFHDGLVTRNRECRQ